jgi:prevent-host-death family protein
MSQIYHVNVGISEFRANLSGYINQVKAGNVIHITQQGEVVAKIVPADYAQKAAQNELAILRESAVVGDVLSPLDESWSADQ